MQYITLSQKRNTTFLKDFSIQENLRGHFFLHAMEKVFGYHDILVITIINGGKAHGFNRGMVAEQNK